MVTVAVGLFQIFQLSSLMGHARLLQKEVHFHVWKEQAEVDRALWGYSLLVSVG